VRGEAVATGAITLVNALATGIGSAVGIGLRVHAEIELHPSGSHGKWDIRVPDHSRTPLVEGALTEALLRYAPGSSGRASLALDSEIPPARGLKSSSAVSSAIVLAVARATDRDADPLEVARLSAAVSRSTGVSATGALDDALASLAPGVVVTNNVEETLLRTYLLPPELGVALYVPPGIHRPAPELVSGFRAHPRLGRSAADHALEGDWVRAMSANTRLVERVIGYDYAALRATVERHGAVASGVSGLGPAFAAIGPRHRLAEIVESMAPHPGDRREVAFSTASPGRSPREP